MTLNSIKCYLHKAGKIEAEEDKYGHKGLLDAILLDHFVQHNDERALLLPNHLPEISASRRQRSLILQQFNPSSTRTPDALKLRDSMRQHHHLRRKLPV